MLLILRILATIALLITAAASLFDGVLTGSSLFGVEPTGTQKIESNLLFLLALFSLLMIIVIFKYRNSGNIMFKSILAYSIVLPVVTAVALALEEKSTFIDSLNENSFPYGDYFSILIKLIIPIAIEIGLLLALFLASFRPVKK